VTEEKNKKEKRQTPVIYHYAIGGRGEKKKLLFPFFFSF
jgi:hypothetical protein